LIARCGICCGLPAARWSGKAAAATKSGTAQSRDEILLCPLAFPAANTANAILRQAGLPKAF
jgi:hypothetical protein